MAASRIHYTSCLRTRDTSLHPWRHPCTSGVGSLKIFPMHVPAFLEYRRDRPTCKKWLLILRNGYFLHCITCTYRKNEIILIDRNTHAPTTPSTMDLLTLDLRGTRAAPWDGSPPPVVTEEHAEAAEPPACGGVVEVGA
jgi:hypothetical protein